MARRNEDLTAFLARVREVASSPRHDQALAEVRALAQAALARLTPNRSATLALHVFGSFALGVCSEGTDIDAICLAPGFLSRETFYREFAALLTESGRVEHLDVILGARVPIVRFRFDGIDFDISFTSLRLQTIPPDFEVREDSIRSQMAGFSEADVASLVSLRTTVYLKEIMQSFASTFPTLLRFIRLWAKSRLIYNHMFGFLAGIECELLSAFIVQKYPNEPAETLISRFFEFCEGFNWRGRSLALNSPYSGLGSSAMTIMTPLEPSHNAMQLATPETVAVIEREFAIASRNCRENRPWDSFIELPEILPGCSRVIKVHVWSRGSADEFAKWRGLVLSKVPSMVRALEGTRQSGYRPTPLPFVFLTPGERGYANCCCFFFGLTGQVRSRVNLNGLPDRRRNLPFAQSDYGGNAMGAEELPIARFREMIATEPYLSQLQARATRAL
jgi:poly(A) polymerase Pap1